VYTDGEAVHIKVYGQTLEARAEFKYLGVVLNSVGNVTAHASARADAFRRAIVLLLAGLSKLPAHSFEFMRFLWSSMVSPVAVYGMELFTWTDSDVAALNSHQAWGWRKLLRVGGRAPLDSVQVLLGFDGWLLECRVRRVAHLLRLANSPPDSLQHVALVSLHLASSPWLAAALQDLRLGLPGVALRVETGLDGNPFMVSNGHVNDEGDWVSVHAYWLPRDALGRRCRTPLRHGHDVAEAREVRKHIRAATSAVRVVLRKDFGSQALRQMSMRQRATAYSKTALLFTRLCQPGPPLHVGLGWVRSIQNRTALACLLTGDWFLGRYAGNFFGKSFLPHTSHDREALAAHGVDASRVCLSCWHLHRQVHLEDESHVCLQCPRYAAARGELMRTLSSALSQKVFATAGDENKLMALIGSQLPSDWTAVAAYMSKIRQSRRKLRAEFETKEAARKRRCFYLKRTAWRQTGRFVCRHGVFFLPRQGRSCPCLGAAVSEDATWQHARWMPALDSDLRCIVLVPFDRSQYIRLGVLQHRMRAQGWR